MLDSARVEYFNNPPRSEHLGWVLETAANHGRIDEPDHEVGDLQEALGLAFALLTEAEQRQIVEYLRVNSNWVENERDEDDDDYEYD